jgi:DNA end-binding protein Ku
VINAAEDRNPAPSGFLSLFFRKTQTAQRFWKGYLKLSLVTCAVSFVPATENRKIRFHMLNRATRNRVDSR